MSLFLIFKVALTTLLLGDSATSHRDFVYVAGYDPTLPIAGLVDMHTIVVIKLAEDDIENEYACETFSVCEAHDSTSMFRLAEYTY
jgi:hypothetical protein